MSKPSSKPHIVGGIEYLAKSDTDYTIHYKTGESGKLTILNGHVFRYYMSPTGMFLDYPIPCNPEDSAKIIAKTIEDYGTDAFNLSTIKETSHHFNINTNEITISFDKSQGTFYVHDKRVGKDVLRESESLQYSETTTQTLRQDKDEMFYGGGMQNGRFTHKGEIIHIVNSNNWLDGGVTSPNPFYWSTNGYGVLRNTWQIGTYDFGSQNPETIKISHNDGYFDAFFFISPRPRHILEDYYELTGSSILMPEFAFYEAHLNTFNRDYWVEVDSGVKDAILFEDGKYYKKYKPQDVDDKHGILESLNGENLNYQFSARAMIDRYKRHDVPLAWFVPNDGYGSGYGQTDTMDGDIDNLKQFIQYANDNGVEVALWTESNLEPKDPENPKKGDRDLYKEVGVGAVALKCDVAWIGEGYSFALNAVEHATQLFKASVDKRVRPFIIMVDGWAGTQRYAGIWSGDQSGGSWENIRFHIPTYVGAGLSGTPVVGSDLDGIYAGGSREVNVRDFQWKTFTPLQLNMDGWGNLPKTPFAHDAAATAINRAYLKLKSTMLPYNYSLAREAVDGLPMVRAMFLEFPNERPAYTRDSQYQFMWGPYVLVAPVYEKSKSVESHSVRDGVYLPGQNQIWVDLFTGQKFQGSKIYNNLKCPLWKIPVFVKEGAILPLVNANNNLGEIEKDTRIFHLYPNNETKFQVYEDDGKSSAYLDGEFAKTIIVTVGPKSNETGDLHILIHKTIGFYNDMHTERSTVLRIMASSDVDRVKVAFNGVSVDIEKVKTEEEFKQKDNVFYYDRRFLVNPYLEYLEKKELHQKCLLVKLEKTDVAATEIQIKIPNYSNKGEVFGSNETIDKTLDAPTYFTALDKEVTATTITLHWNVNKLASYYEIERDDVIFSNILGDQFTFKDFKSETEHSFRIRSVNEKGVSKWSYRLIVETAEDNLKNTVKDVSVTCDIPCQPNQEICKLTDGFSHTLWHTDWNSPKSCSDVVTTLNFDLDTVYEIDKVVYIPREDAGNGTFLKIRYFFSSDEVSWAYESPIITWERDNREKTIAFDGVKFRYFKLVVHESVGGFGSGRNVLFFKKV